MGNYKSLFQDESANEPQISEKRKLDDVQDTQDTCNDTASLAPSKSKKPKTVKKPIASKSKSQVENESAVAEDVDECPICFEHYRSSADKTFLPCAHYFHKACIDQWLAIKNECPFCRTVPTSYAFPTSDTMLKTDTIITKTDTQPIAVKFSTADTFPTPDAFANVSTAATVSNPTDIPVTRYTFQSRFKSISTYTPDSSCTSTHTSHSTHTSDSSHNSKSVCKTKSAQKSKSSNKTKSKSTKSATVPNGH